MRYAITGATGFVGGALASQLRKSGHDVVALVRDRSRAGALERLGCEFVEGDLDDAAALDRLCAGADGLFHVAGWYKLGQRDPSLGTKVNVEGTRNALAAAQRNGVPRVVYTSTLAVNSDTEEQVVDETYRFTGEHVSVYDRTKAEAHDIALDFVEQGLDVVIVQPGLVYGPGDTAQTGDLIAQVANGKRPFAPKGGGVCWAHVDDIADGHVRAMERGRKGESYMLAGPRATLAEGLRGRPHRRHQGTDRAAGADGRRHRRSHERPRQGRPGAPGLLGRDDAGRAGHLLRHAGQGGAGAGLARATARAGPARDRGQPPPALTRRRACQRPAGCGMRHSARAGTPGDLGRRLP